ncbi:MAG: bacteriohopanetetrol glucosamine biosynthesis glycosyltransferase HpnI [Syntrophobacteraceae bacterium]
MLIESIRFLLLVLTLASACYYLAAMLAAHGFFSRKTPPLPAMFPPVSIMIPLCNVDFRAYENYAALCRQDYPDFQIVFGVCDPSDSSVALVNRLKADFPRTAIDVAVSANQIGQNPKANNLENMLPLARHDILVLMDSDIRVGPDFLRTITSELLEIGPGLVTCLYRAGEAPGLAAKLEAVGITADFAPGVLVAEETAGISFAFGASIALGKDTLARIGGFKAVADYIADDYMLGNLVRKAGLPVRLSRCVVETVLSRLSTPDFIRHQVRWARTIRACGRLGHTGSIITNGTVLASFYLASTGFSGPGWLLFLSVVGLRMAMARFVGVHRMGDGILRRYFPLVLLRDLFSFFFWCAALFGNRVVWRGKTFRIDRNGKMTPEP